MNKQILQRVVFGGLLLIPFIPFLVYGGFFFPFITTKAFAFRIIVEIILGAYVLLALIDEQYRPKFTAISKAVALFIVVVGVANLFGVEPVKSFWSNFERMEGYITILHLGALFVVMGSVLKDKEWRWWWNTTLVASALMVLYCLVQLACAPGGCTLSDGTKVFQINQGGVRVDGKLGNAAYLALYLLVHVFIALYYLAKSKTSGLRWSYGLLILGQIFVLYHTATRGATIGLLGGFFLVAILNIFNKEDARLRKLSKYSLTVLVLFVSLFFLARNTQFVQSSPVLSRFSNISLSSLRTEGRAFVWPMAVQGIKEKPLLGWGQDNFNYVFAEHYSGEMYKIEPWFDRAHNIFLDWGISAGILGLLAYLYLYFVFLKELWRKESSLSFLERSTLTGLISAYFFNNFFVFDNLTSYILFFSLLAYLNSKNSSSKVYDQTDNDSFDIVTNGSIVLVVTLVSIYFLNVKPIIANTNLINALNNKQPIQSFEKAYNASRLGRPEVVEWISSSSQNLFASQSIKVEDKNAYFEFARNAIEETTAELSGDPRYELVAGNFYLNTGMSEEAFKHFNKAKELMPQKQIIYFNLGQLAIQQGKNNDALSYFKQAYDLAPEYEEARYIYAIGAVFAKDTNLLRDLISKMKPNALIDDPRILSAMYQTKQINLLLSTLNDLRLKLPEKKNEIDSYIKQIQNGSL